MSNLTIFTFEEQQVRFVGTADKPEWIAQDVCNVLGIEEPSSVLRNFDPDEKGVHLMHTPGGKQSMLTVTEFGLYRLIFRSNKPIAKKFQRWIIQEVIPSIRRTGSYTVPGVNPEAQRLEKLELEVENLKLKLELVKIQGKSSPEKDTSSPLDLILQISQQKGAVSARDVQKSSRFFRKCSTEQIRKWFFPTRENRERGYYRRG